jgi:predicted sulfurtransferase
MPLSFESLLDLKALLQKTAERHQILGLIVLGPEGINSTLSALFP